MSQEQGLEMAECAKINLVNLSKMVPGLKEHPFYKVVEMQLDQCIKELEEDE